MARRSKSIHIELTRRSREMDMWYSQLQCLDGLGVGFARRCPLPSPFLAFRSCNLCIIMRKFVTCLTPEVPMAKEHCCLTLRDLRACRQALNPKTHIEMTAVGEEQGSWGHWVSQPCRAEWKSPRGQGDLSPLCTCWTNPTASSEFILFRWKLLAVSACRISEVVLGFQQLHVGAMTQRILSESKHILHRYFFCSLYFRLILVQ